MNKFLFFFFLLSSFLSFAQPVNDECATATIITPSLDLTCTSSIHGTVLASTASPQGNSCNSYDDDDVWYSFVASSTMHRITLSNIVGSTIDMYFSVYTNPCDSAINQILCSDNNFSNVVGLTIGETYYLRVYTKNNYVGMDTQFDICINTPPLIPSNNDCLGAIPLFVNSIGTCDSLGYGTINGATSSPESNSCSGSVFHDVWYSFIASETATKVKINPLNESPINYYHAVYSGNCGSVLTALKCSDLDSSFVTGLVIGQRYFVRVYSTATVLEGIVCDFSICISLPPTPPTNDECINAIQTPVNEDFSYALVSSGTVENATQSNQYNACYSSNYDLADDDVWYQFTATRTTHSIAIIDIGGDSQAISYSVTRGTCTSLATPTLCDNAFDPEAKLMNNLTVGATYFVRIYSSDASGPHTTTFTFGIGSQPIPINDTCTGAIELTVSPTNTYVGNSVSILYATQSTDTTDCLTSDLADVWYKFTALDTSHVINIHGAYSNSADHLEYDFYRGSCQNFVNNVFCDRQYANQLNDLTIGEVYYIKVHGPVTTTNPISTAISIRTVPNREINDECSNATLIDINSDIVCDTLYTGSLLNATPSMYPGNRSTQDDDVWVKFKADDFAQAISISDPSNGNAYFDLYFYKSCGDVTHFAAAGYTKNYILQNLIQDSIYYIRISSSFVANSFPVSFDLCIKKHDTPINDDCSNAIPLYVNDGISCDSLQYGTIYKSTASSQVNSCLGQDDDDNDDVWFTFEAKYPTQYVNLTRTAADHATLKFALYSGDCSSLAQINCYNSDDAVSGLTVGETYILRAYSSGVLLDLTTVFSICITSPPINDECFNSIEIPVNTTFTCVRDTSGNLFKSTPSSPVITCSNASANDIWYHFVASNPTHWLTIPYGYSLSYSLYRYNCDSIGNPLFCQDGTIDNNFTLIATNLTVGDTFLVRIYKNVGVTALTNFDICVSTPGGPIPPNDECAGAIDIPTNDLYTCDTLLVCSVTSGVTASTTLTCNPNDFDVWYKFVANSNEMEVEFSYSSGTVIQRSIALYNGNCGALGSQMYCGTNTRFSNLTIGNTYYLRVVPNNRPSYPTDIFNICLKKYFIPANNECVNAFDVPINHSLNCDTMVHGTLFHASSSTAGGYCSSIVPVNDIWFKFVATTTKLSLTLLNENNMPQSYNQYDLRWSVYSGSCGSLGTPIICSTYGSVDFGALTNLVIGNTYYIRVYNANNTTNLLLNFDLCLRIPPPPVNDECINATVVQSEVDNSCTITTAGTLHNATPSIQSNSCSNTNDDDDVWYKFVATSSSHAVNLLNVLANADMYHSVYSGSCASLIDVVCSSPNSSVLSGLTIDSTYYVRVYSESNVAQSTTFNICTGPYLALPTCVDNTPAGNDCESATAICDFNGYCGRTSGFYTTESWLEFDTTFCGTIENNSFLSFVPDSDSLNLNVWVTSSVTNLGIQIFIFSAENCQGPVQNFACWDPHYVPPGHKLLTANGLIPGNKYYMMIDGQGGDICDYTFSSDANISNPIVVSPQVVDICFGDSVLLTASGGDGTFDWRASSDITEVTENSIYFKASDLDSNSVFVTSFVNNTVCSPLSEIEFQINIRECICPIFATNNSDSCVNNSFDLFATEVFGASFEWNDGNGVISNLENPIDVIPPSVAGTHIYTVTATNAFESCSATTQIVINPIADASFVFDDTVFCQFATNPIPTISGQAGGSFTSNSFDMDVNTSSGEINLSNTLLGNYDVTYTTAGICPQSSTQEISIVSVPTINTILNQEICLNDTFAEVSFSGNNVDSFTWTNDNDLIGLASSGTGNIASFSPLIDDLVSNVTVTPLGLACNGNPVSFTLTVFENPTVNPVLDQEICLSDSFSQVVFSGNNANSFTWTNDNISLGLASSGSGNINSFYSLVDNATAIISVTPHSLTCDGNPISFNLSVLESPTVSFAQSDSICSSGQSFELTGGIPSGGTYSGNSVVNNVFNPSLAGIGSHYITYTYVDVLTNCSASDSSLIEVLNCADLTENKINKIQIFPNPTEGMLHIQSNGNFNFELTDTHGKLITFGDRNKSTVLNLEQLSKGVYYLKVISETNTVLEKIVVE
ncbi:MAG: T9SS type A sorting domain-containing protein [Bacteroidota bacterium]